MNATPDLRFARRPVNRVPAGAGFGSRWGVLAAFLLGLPGLRAAELRAGVAKVDITDRGAGPVNDPSFAKALVLEIGATKAAPITLDAVAVGEIGRIGNGFMATVRQALEKELGIPPAAVVVNASHCHARVRGDTAELVVEAVREAAGNLAPTRVGSGAGHEDRISENRRRRMKDGREVDMRRSYAMPPDEEVTGDSSGSGRL